MKLKVFQVITLRHPKNDDDEADTIILGGGIREVLAVDEKQAGVLAARMIPDGEIRNLHNIEVIVRPF